MESLSTWVLAAPAAKLWFFAILSVAAALAAFYFSFRFLYRARVIENTPTAKVRSAAQGYVELIGTGRWLEGPPIIAPLSGAECTWYSFKVQERKERSSKGSNWRTIESGTSDDMFGLEDETGVCIIDPQGAEVTPSAAIRWYGQTPRPQQPYLHEPGWLGNLGGLLGASDYRYTEKRLLRNEPLYAVGQYKTSGTDFQGEIGPEIAAILRHWKQHPETYLKPFDTNRDGDIDVREWEAARAAAREQAVQERADKMAGPVTNVLSKPADRTQPFLLSGSPQFNLVRRLKVLAAASISAFLLLGGAVSWMLLVRYSA